MIQYKDVQMDGFVKKTGLRTKLTEVTEELHNQ